MKKLSSIRLTILLAAALCLLAGCMPKPCKFEPLKGDGNIVSRTIEISDFNTIVMEMPVELHYIESAKPFLRITGDSNLIAAMQPRVERHKLLLAVCWPDMAMATQDRLTMFPTQPLVVEVGSSKLEHFGWNIEARLRSDIMQKMNSGKDPKLYVAEVDMEGDSMAALSLLRLDGEPLRMDVCYGTSDSILQHVEQLEQLRPVWERKWMRRYSLDEKYIGNDWYYEDVDFPIVTDTVLCEE